MLGAFSREPDQLRQGHRGQVFAAVVPAERAGDLEAVGAVFGERAERGLGQVHQFRHVPVVQEILVIGQGVERGAVFGYRFAAQVLRAQAPVAAVGVADDQIAEGVGAQHFDGGQPHPAPGLVDIVNSNHGRIRCLLESAWNHRHALRFYSRASLQFDSAGLGKCRGNAGYLIYIERFPAGKRKSR